MEKKTYSTQKKYFGTIPKSEFYGVCIGYALGLILTGFFRMETQIPQLVLALIGFGIGYYIDKKYYTRPVEPESEEAAGPEAALAAETVANTAESLSESPSGEAQTDQK